MKPFIYLGLLVLVIAKCSANPVETQRSLEENENNLQTDDQSYLFTEEYDPEEEADIDIIPLEDILGLVTPDGELIADPELENEIFGLTAGNEAGNRKKRWVPLAVGLAVRGYRAYRGWRAARTIRRGTQVSPFKPKMRVKQYERPGNFRDAFQTFKSVRPTDVKRFSQNGIAETRQNHIDEVVSRLDKVRGATGRVGDRTITVRNKSDSGRPTVEMFKTNAKKSDRITDKIRYND